MKTGYCWEPSIASDRNDAFRCFVGANAIYDPCFAAGADQVFCPSDLPPTKGILLHLTQPLPTFRGTDRPGEAPAWAMQLRSGPSCAVITGTGIAGFPFGCGSGLYCSTPSAPIGGVQYAACGMPSSSGLKVPKTQTEEIAYIWR